MEPWKIGEELFDQGISPKLKGFHYICSALSLLIGQRRVLTAEDAARAIRTVGGQNVRRTECCMRYAIRRAWELGEGSIRLSFPNLSYPPAVVEYLLVTQWRLAAGAEAADKVDKRVKRL